MQSPRSSGYKKHQKRTSSGKQCCVRGDVRSKVPQGAGGEGTAAACVAKRTMRMDVRDIVVVFTMNDTLKTS